MAVVILTSLMTFIMHYAKTQGEAQSRQREKSDYYALTSMISSLMSNGDICSSLIYQGSSFKTKFDAALAQQNQEKDLGLPFKLKLPDGRVVGKNFILNNPEINKKIKLYNLTFKKASKVFENPNNEKWRGAVYAQVGEEHDDGNSYTNLKEIFPVMEFTVNKLKRDIRACSINRDMIGVKPIPKGHLVSCLTKEVPSSMIRAEDRYSTNVLSCQDVFPGTGAEHLIVSATCSSKCQSRKGQTANKGILKAEVITRNSYRCRDTWESPIRTMAQHLSPSCEGKSYLTCCRIKN